MKEAIPKTVSKKRGRPSVFAPAVVDGYRSAFPEIASARALQNKAYGGRAHELLRDDPECKWLFGSGYGGGRAKGAASRATILAELGRIPDDQDLLATARQICAIRPSSKRAVMLIRQARLGKVPAVDVLALANAIIKTMNAYLEGHPEFTKEQVDAALATVAATVNQSFAGDGEDGVAGG